MKNSNKKKQNHTSHIAPHTSQKGITLIALIITIIVMLILVGVTINVALNGGLFTKAEDAANSTTVEAEKEALSMAAIAAWDVENGVDWGAMQLPDGFSGSAGTYTSNNSKKTYKVDKATAKVTEGGAEEIDEDLAYLKAELEGKMLSDVITGSDSNGYLIFKDSEITSINYIEDFDYNIIAGIIMYKGKYYQVKCDDFTLQNPKIIKVEKNIYTDNYFRIGIEGTKVKILGLTQKGKADIAKTKKLIIPATILGSDGVTYNVTEINRSAFIYNKDIEQLEFESGSKLEKIGEAAFFCCNISGEVIIPDSVTTIIFHAFWGSTSIEKITIPVSVNNLGQGVFYGWTSDQTVFMKGRTEAPATVDGNYTTGIGWAHDWQYNCNANIVWDN